MFRPWRIWLLVICLLGASLRFHGLFANTFHADEALFAGWARLIAVWRDPLLLTQAVDKPPLLFYLQALFYPLFGPVEWAARMPSLIASLLTIPLTAQLARRLTGDLLVAVSAALLVAVAPLAVQFSATAFSDPLLTFWLLAALYGACRIEGQVANHAGGHPPLWTAFWVGLLFGLALATKYQALLFAPLLIGIVWLAGGDAKYYARAATGFLAVVALLFLWQMARPMAGGPVALQWANIGGVRLVRSWELLPRLADYARLWLMAMGRPMAVGAAIALGAGGLIHSRIENHADSGRVANQGWVMNPSHQAAGIMLGLFVLGYLLLHWLWAVPVWDRYLLPVFPLVAILIAGCVSSLWRAARRKRPLRMAMAATLVVLSLAQLPVALAARAGQLPIGGRPNADGGAATTARLLKDAPYGTVLYDHWYSWHWRYQLFDGRVYVSWFPHTDALLADLGVFAGQGPPRYIALPSSAVARPIIRRLSENGYRLELLDAGVDAPDMNLYRIIPEDTDD